jgi:hypothetical protein
MPNLAQRPKNKKTVPRVFVLLAIVFLVIVTLCYIVYLLTLGTEEKRAYAKIGTTLDMKNQECNYTYPSIDVSGYLTCIGTYSETTSTEATLIRKNLEKAGYEIVRFEVDSPTPGAIRRNPKEPARVATVHGKNDRWYVYYLIGSETNEDKTYSAQLKYIR